MTRKETDAFTDPEKDKIDLFTVRGFKNIFDAWDTKKISSDLTPQGETISDLRCPKNAK